MGEWIEHRGRYLPAVRDDVAEFGRCGLTVLQPQVRLAAKVSRPELGRWGMVVPPHGLEKLDGARGISALKGDGSRGEGNLQTIGEDRFRKSLRQLARQLQRFAFGSADGQGATRMLQRSVVPAQGKPGGRLAASLAALPDDRMHFGVFDGHLRRDLVEVPSPRRLNALGELVVCLSYASIETGRLRLPAERRVGFADAKRRLEFALHRRRIPLNEGQQ